MFDNKAIKILQAENEYLRKLVDNLLLRAGVAPVTDTFVEETEDEKKEKAIVEKGAIRYGE